MSGIKAGRFSFCLSSRLKHKMLIISKGKAMERPSGDLARLSGAIVAIKLVEIRLRA